MYNLSNGQYLIKINITGTSPDHDLKDPDISDPFELVQFNKRLQQ